MRDIALLGVLLVLWPLALKRPWIGILTWAWLSLNVPQLQTYGFMFGTPVAMVTAVLTMIGILVSREPKSLPMSPPIVLLIVFTLWMCVTYPFSLVDTDSNAEQLEKVLKINLFTLLCALVLYTRRQIDWLIIVVTLSVAFFGIKGGIFTITTGGAFRVRGEGGFLHGNNEVGLGLVMTVPLLYYLVYISPNKWLKRALLAAMALTAVAALGTQSRGALLAIAAMSAMLIVRSPHPLRFVVPVIAGAVLMLMFMPESWWDRMETIRDYKEDESAMGRINAWILAWNIATSNFFGGGFVIEYQQIFNQYAPNPNFIAVAHSIYFQVLGHHGFVGLILFLAFWWVTWLNAGWVAKNSPDPKDAVLARMIQVSLVGYFVGGAFLNLAYFDGPYYLSMALVVLRSKLLQRGASVTGTTPLTGAATAQPTPSRQASPR
jgi:putative inorganic carbon (hco3(-)) transporter